MPKSKQAANPILFDLDALLLASADGGGFCIDCGAEAYNIEPDARNYQCESCQRMTVYGAEELILMGAVKDTP